MKGSSAGSKRSVNRIDLTVLEEIVQDVVDTVERAREDIYFLADQARREYTRLAGELAELKQEVSEVIRMVEECEKEEKKSRRRLVEVSRDFEKYTEEDIKEAYDTARNMQVQLSILRERERNLHYRRDMLERNLRQIEQLASRAESMVGRVNVAVKMLQGNAEIISEQIEDAFKKQQIGIWIVQAQEEERRKIARELHDGPAQSLANIVMRLSLIERLWEQDQEWVKREISALTSMVRDNITEVRRVIFDLRPMALDDLGLVPAMRRYLADYRDKHGLDVHFLFFGEERRLPLPVEVALFRLTQEALSNVRKHAEVDEAVVKLEITPRMATIVIKDDGRGFDVARASEKGRYGLLGMRERVELFNGELTIKSRLGHGTQVIISIPVGEGE
ncbi:MAG: histidine kinase [Syntrophomonadaceae bacterium]|nr:histidine kinase [Syntrophomonadaceae bacterium]